MTQNEVLVANTPFLDMGTATNFGNEAANMSEKVISWTIINNTTATHTVALTPSYFAQNGIQISSGTLLNADGEAITGLTAASNTEVAIEQAIAEIMHFPTRVLRTQIESSNTSQLSVAINLQGKNMCGNPAPKKINLGAYKSTGSFDKELIIVTQGFQLEASTEITIPVLPRKAEGTPTSVTIIMYLGAQMDADLALERLAQLALSDPATAALAAQYLS
jgi:hypothetical protein